MGSVAVFVKGVGKILFPDTMGPGEISAALASKGREALDDSTAARMGRAAESHDPENFYHGTGSPDIESFLPSKTGNLGPGVYATPDPEQASKRAVLSKYRNRDKGTAPNVLQTRVKKDLNFYDVDENPFMDLDVDRLAADGYDGVRRSENGQVAEINIFDPANIRSTNAMFDPSRKDSSNLLAGGAAGAVGVTGLLGGEEAEAGVFSVPLSRLLSIGMMNPAFVNDPKAIKKAYKAYDKLKASSPGFADREGKAALGGFTQGWQKTDLGERKIITPGDMQGKALVSVMGDRSDIGTVDKVAGIELPYSVKVEGGAGFPQKHQDQGLGWASELSIALKKHTALQKAGFDSGQDVMGVYSAMGRDSINYSTPIAEIMMAQMPDLNKIARTDKLQFDAELRKAYPQWVGLDDPRAMDQLKGVEYDGLPRLPGKARTNFSTIMGKAEYRAKGFPTYNDAVEIATNPDLADVNVGDSGYAMFDARPGERVGLFDQHQTYNAKIPGQYAGGFEESIPNEIMFPDAYAAQRQRLTNPSKAALAKGAVPQPFTHTQAMNAIGTRGDVHQLADQKWVDTTSKYIESRKLGRETGSADPRLLALLGGAGATGTAAMYAQQGNETPTEQAHRVLAARDYQDTVTAEEHPNLQNAGDWLDRTIQTPVTGPIFPGVANYLRDFGRDDTSTSDRAASAFWAGLDVMP